MTDTATETPQDADDLLGQLADAADADSDPGSGLDPRPCETCGELIEDPNSWNQKTHQGACRKKKDRKRRRGTSPSSGPSLKRQIETSLTTLALITSRMDPVCGPVVMEQAPDVADALYNLAQSNDRIRRMLEAAASGGGVIQLLVAVAPIVMAVYSHHVAGDGHGRPQADDGDRDEQPASVTPPAAGNGQVTRDPLDVSPDERVM